MKDLVKDLVNKIITSIRLIFYLRVKDIRRINHDTYWLRHLLNVQQIHLEQVRQRHIRRSEYKMLYANHTIYGLVKRR